ncbi:MAG: hypothetical protein WBN22_11430 [Verrucomicrobiia bacterium]
MSKKLCALRRAYFVLVVMILPAVNSDASSIIYQFEPISPVRFPGGQTPQIQATFQDESPGTVLLTITSPDLGCGEFLSDLYFNFDPADNVKRLCFAGWDGACGQAFATISTGANAFKADGGYYDVHFDFSRMDNGKGAGDDSIAYLITGRGLDAFDFAFVDSTGNCANAYGTYYALARIKGICGKDEWLGCRSVQPVPEPSPLGLLASATGLGWCIGPRLNRMTRTRRFLKNYFNPPMLS